MQQQRLDYNDNFDVDFVALMLFERPLYLVVVDDDADDDVDDDGRDNQVLPPMDALEPLAFFAMAYPRVCTKSPDDVAFCKNFFF
jgi:hypothetical protein